MQKISICYLEFIKSYCLKKIEKITLRLQNSKIFENFDLTILKNQIFLSKKSFLAIEKYDIEQRNIKVLDKKIMPPGSAQAPEGESVLLLF